jgi:hypothetical protein
MIKTMTRKKERKQRSHICNRWMAPRTPSLTKQRRKSLTSSRSCKARRRTMPRRIGRTKKPNCSCGPFKSIAVARTSLHRSLERMIGYKLLDSYPEGMILSASINSIRIKSQPFKRATGSREKMRSWSNSFEKMVPNSGVRLLTSSIQI